MKRNTRLNFSAPFSYQKGKAIKKSDIDILVDFFESPVNLKLEKFLSRLLGRKVDLLTPRALKPLIKKEILRETIYINNG